MVAQSTGETSPAADEEDDVLVGSSLSPVEGVRDTSDSERVRLGGEVADRRQNNIGVLARLPVEASAEGETDGVMSQKLHRRM